MLEGILQGLIQWIYGLFLDLMTFCADALLGIMSTDLQFFEESVPIVPILYGIFIAVGWGLLIGNCAFQAIKAMFAGFGFETESPAILLLRTFLFGFLLIFADSICEIGLSIGKRVIDLLGIPESVALTMPEEAMFSGAEAPWLLVIIIGFVLGFQLIKLFFEIAERYVLVGVLTMLCPVGLAFGGSKSTKDICTGFIRTYVSMIVMMVMNVLFLKLILSALATMPDGALILPWCLLVVGIARTARKADQLVSRIGLSPATTGDPLGAGRGLMATAMAARTVMSIVGKTGSGKVPGGSGGSSGRTASSTGKPGGSTFNSARNFGIHNGTNSHSSKNGTNVAGGNTNAGANNATTVDGSYSTQRNNTNSNMGGSKTVANHKSGSAVRFGAQTYAGGNQTANTSSGRTQFHNTGKVQTNRDAPAGQPGSSHNSNLSNTAGSQASNTHSGRVQFSSSGKTQINTNRFGGQPGAGTPAGSGNAGSPGNLKNPEPGRPSAVNTPVSAAAPTSAPQQGTARASFGQTGQAPKAAQPASGTKSFGNTRGTTGQGASHTGPKNKPAAAAPKSKQQKSAKPAGSNPQTARFGSVQGSKGARPNAVPTGTGAKPGSPHIGTMRTAPGSGKNTVKPDKISGTDTAKEIRQDSGQGLSTPKDGETDG